MAPLDTAHMFRKLRIDTSTASSPGNSTANTPALPYRSRSAERSTRSSDWEHSWTCINPEAENQQHEHDFTCVQRPSRVDESTDPWSASLAGPSFEDYVTIEKPHHELPTDSTQGRETSPSPPKSVPRGRQISISFKPTVTLDSGHEKGLGERISATDRGNTAVRPRGRSLLQELSEAQASQSPSSRARISVDRLRTTNNTGEPLVRPIRPSKVSQAHLTMFRTSGEESSQSPHGEEQDSVASLTSESTSSPLIEEAATPPETPADFTLSPLSATSSLHQASSMGNSASSWPIAQRHASVQRSKSYNIDRTRSLRSRREVYRCSSASFSPANAFLSSLGSVSAPAPPEPDDEGQEIGDYVLGKQIGYGGFSIVREARTIEGDYEVKRAVKIVRKHIIDKTDRENEQVQSEFEHEVSLWRFLNHAHILPLLAVYNTPFATFCFTQLHSHGSLFQLVRANRQGLPLPLVKRYAFQLASAVRYLHEDAHIVHRDIKLENCLLDMSDEDAAALGGNLLLCDFGMAEFLVGNADDDDDAHSDISEPYDEMSERPPPKKIGPSDTSTSVVGSLEYASPELLKSSAPFVSKAADIWAYGVSLFALLVGELPFQHPFLAKTRMMITNGEWNRSALDNLSDDSTGRQAIDLLKGCLEMDPIVRWNVGHVLHCLWLEDCHETFETELAAGWEL